MRKKTIVGNYDGAEVKFSYTVEKAENVRLIRIERLDEDDDPCEEHVIIITKIGHWYFMSCPEKGTAEAGIGYIHYGELVADTIQGLGFGDIETDAFTYVVLEIAEYGF